MPKARNHYAHDRGYWLIVLLLFPSYGGVLTEGWKEKVGVETPSGTYGASDPRPKGRGPRLTWRRRPGKTEVAINKRRDRQPIRANGRSRFRSRRGVITNTHAGHRTAEPSDGPRASRYAPRAAARSEKVQKTDGGSGAPLRIPRAATHPLAERPA